MPDNNPTLLSGIFVFRHNEKRHAVLSRRSFSEDGSRGVGGQAFA
jgi:hypothetical protein